MFDQSFVPFVGSLVFLCIASVRLHAEPPSDQSPLHERIDQLIAAKANGPLAESASDGEFLRRVYFDLTGHIPSLQETQEFLAGANAKTANREKLIDTLLAGDEYPRRMTELFSVMLMERQGENEDWQRFLTDSFRANKPWNQMVREILHPNPDDEAVRGAAYFFTKRLEHYGENPVDIPGMVRDVGRLFLGVDVQFAQCHDHLFVSDYKQEFYQGLFAFVGHTTIRSDLKFPALAENLVKDKVAFKSVFEQIEKKTGPRLPFRPEVEIPALSKEEEYLVPPDKKSRAPGVPRFSPLTILADQLPRAENEQFTKNIANRLWWILMGRGLVQPLDFHHSQNPPSHPELLDALAKEFAGHGFDMKWLLREVALSSAYQRSSLLPEGQSDVAEASYRVFLEKPLSAEQLLYSVVQATGTEGRKPLLAAGSKEGVVADSPTNVVGKSARDRFTKAFANPAREPEVGFSPTLKAALFVMNDSEILDRLHPQPGNLVDRLLKQTDAKLLAHELYLSVLTREPSDEECAEVAEYLGSHGERREAAIGHLVWSLLASTEFCTNH